MAMVFFFYFWSEKPKFGQILTLKKPRSWQKNGLKIDHCVLRRRKRQPAVRNLSGTLQRPLFQFLTCQYADIYGWQDRKWSRMLFVWFNSIDLKELNKISAFFCCWTGPIKCFYSRNWTKIELGSMYQQVLKAAEL